MVIRTYATDLVNSNEDEKLWRIPLRSPSVRPPLISKPLIHLKLIFAISMVIPSCNAHEKYAEFPYPYCRRLLRLIHEKPTVS